MGLEAQFAHGDLEVGPCLFFLTWVAQEKRGVIGDDELCAAKRVDAATQAGKGLALA